MEQRNVCVVTGGRGFLARHLVNKLLESEKWLVRIMDLMPKIQISDQEKQLAAALEAGRAEYVSADLRNLPQVIEALKNAEVVFHMAAPDPAINNYKLHFSVNVTGTSNVIEACVQQGVKKLIYTSSPSVVFDHINGMRNATESLPYPAKLMDSYSETKAQGEALVLEANGRGGLVTCAIRPSGLFGPGDRVFLPSIIAAARAGKLKFQIGNGENQFDWTYVGNVVHGHLCAEQALDPGAPHGEDAAAGKAFFITNCEPVRFWDFISEFLERLGYPRPKYKLPVSLVLPLSFASEWACKQLAPLGVPAPVFTPARIRYTSLWRTFSCERACKLLKYKPIYTVEEGIQKTLEAYEHLRAPESKPNSSGAGGVFFVVALLSFFILFFITRLYPH